MKVCFSFQPERIDPPDPTRPDYDIRADVWSLGISLVRNQKRDWSNEFNETKWRLYYMNSEITFYITCKASVASRDLSALIGFHTLYG